MAGGREQGAGGPDASQRPASTLPVYFQVFLIFWSLLTGKLTIFTNKIYANFAILIDLMHKTEET